MDVISNLMASPTKIALKEKIETSDTLKDSNATFSYVSKAFLNKLRR